jgi:hypothetical protein
MMLLILSLQELVYSLVGVHQLLHTSHSVIMSEHSIECCSAVE